MRLSDSSLVTICERIVAGLTNNPYFPNTSQEFETFQTAFKAFKKEMPTSSVRNADNSISPNPQKEKLVISISALVKYVENVAQGNLDILNSSGFEITINDETKTNLRIVDNVVIHTQDTPGLLTVECTAQPKAQQYQARVSTDCVTWQWFNSSTTSKVHLYNLPVDQMLFIEMRVANSKGVGPWSTACSTKLTAGKVGYKMDSLV